MSRRTHPRPDDPTGQLSWRGLRLRCDELLATVPVPEPFELGEFLAALGAKRGRAIRMVDLPARRLTPTARRGAPLACGMALQLPTEDVIFVEPRDWVYRVHVVLHEVSHRVCGHLGDGPGLDHLRLFPDLDPALVRAALGRTRYSEPQEIEAEAMASVLTERLVGRDMRSASGRTGLMGVAHRIEETLGTP